MDDYIFIEQNSLKLKGSLWQVKEVGLESTVRVKTKRKNDSNIQQVTSMTF